MEKISVWKNYDKYTIFQKYSKRDTNIERGWTIILLGYS